MPFKLIDDVVVVSLARRIEIFQEWLARLADEPVRQKAIKELASKLGEKLIVHGIASVRHEGIEASHFEFRLDAGTYCEIVCGDDGEFCSFEIFTAVGESSDQLHYMLWLKGELCWTVRRCLLSDLIEGLEKAMPGCPIDRELEVPPEHQSVVLDYVLRLAALH